MFCKVCVHVLGTLEHAKGEEVGAIDMADLVVSSQLYSPVPKMFYKIFSKNRN